MNLIYGTTNPGKVNSMKKILNEMDVQLLSLKDFNIEFPYIDESGNDPLQNAKLKALAYYKLLNRPVFSCDSGLFIQGLEDHEQPGVHVRRVNGKSLNDKEMIEHYSSLSKRLGGEAVVKYKNAICLVINENTIIEYDGDDILFMDNIDLAKQLKHEIEFYDNISGRLISWVKIPVLSDTTDTTIYMYYGNPDCENHLRHPLDCPDLSADYRCRLFPIAQ